MGKLNKNAMVQRTITKNEVKNRFVLDGPNNVRNEGSP